MNVNSVKSANSELSHFSPKDLYTGKSPSVVWQMVEGRFKPKYEEGYKVYRLTGVLQSLSPTRGIECLK